MKHKKAILLFGPTASGKSGLAVDIAKKFRGEIINADSMQVYKEIKILSARPENKSIKHHLYGFVSVKENFSVALMIDQRVSEGESVEFFKRPAKTTTIPAQLVKKYKCRIVPVYIERIENLSFKLSFNKPISFDENLSINQISLELNKLLEKMILKNPDQWIWSHDRWK